MTSQGRQGMEEDQSLYVFCQLALAVEHMHSKRLIHRRVYCEYIPVLDLQPEEPSPAFSPANRALLTVHPVGIAPESGSMDDAGESSLPAASCRLAGCAPEARPWWV